MGNYYQKVLTKTLSPVIWQLGIDKMFSNSFSGKGQILMFHRVIPNTKYNRIHNHLSLEIEPDHLKKIIDFFREKDYEFIKLDDLKIWLENNKNNSRKFVIFTFDDGYLDNLEYAFPIFKQENIPFTIYITTSFPERNALLWWYILEEIVLYNNVVDFTHQGNKLTFKCPSHTKKETVFNKIRNLIMSYNEKDRNAQIEIFVKDYGYSILDKNEELTLNWEQITRLSQNPLVTIGAHTLNHYNLCSISHNDALNEIYESKLLIESKIGKSVDHFSYPLGKYNANLANYCKNIGFKTATTTKNANIFYDHINHMWTLPRINVNSLTSPKVLQLQVNGFFPALLHKFKKVIAF